MSRRSYQQDCPIARALDVVGERWTLLLLRDLAGGPKRFSDLRQSLPAMGANLLAERLRALQEQGLVEQGDAGYNLSTGGESMRPLLRELAAVGASLPAVPASVSPQTPAARTRLLMLFNPRLAEGQRLSVSVQVDAEQFCCFIDNGRLGSMAGPAPLPADVQLLASRAAFERVLDGKSPEGEFRLLGSAPALALFRQLFALPGRETPRAW